MTSQDPYNLVKQELQEMVNELNEKYVRWTEQRPNSPLKSKTGEELERGSSSILWQLDELQQAIEVASQNPSRFNLTETELSNRQSWVRKTRREINTIQDSVKASNDRVRRSELVPAPGIESENQAFLSGQLREQEMIARKQDEELDDMEQAVERIGNVGLSIHEELKAQRPMLDALGEEVDITSSRIKAAQAKIADVLRRSGGNCQICTIVALTIILFILIVVAVVA